MSRLMRIYTLCTGIWFWPPGLKELNCEILQKKMRGNVRTNPIIELMKLFELHTKFTVCPLPNALQPSRYRAGPENSKIYLKVSGNSETPG